MARGRKPYNVTHIIAPTAQTEFKKKAKAQVLIAGTHEVVFEGKSRNDCAKWIYGGRTEGSIVKIQYLTAPLGVTLKAAVSPVDFYDHKTKSKVSLVPTEKTICGDAQKPKYAFKTVHEGRTLTLMVSKEKFEATQI